MLVYPSYPGIDRYPHTGWIRHLPEYIPYQTQPWNAPSLDMRQSNRMHRQTKSGVDTRHTRVSTPEDTGMPGRYPSSTRVHTLPSTPLKYNIPQDASKVIACTIKKKIGCFPLLRGDDALFTAVTAI